MIKRDTCCRKKINLNQLEKLDVPGREISLQPRALRFCDLSVVSSCGRATRSRQRRKGSCSVHSRGGSLGVSAEKCAA